MRSMDGVKRERTTRTLQRVRRLDSSLDTKADIHRSHRSHLPHQAVQWYGGTATPISDNMCGHQPTLCSVAPALKRVWAAVYTWRIRHLVLLSLVPSHDYIITTITTITITTVKAAETRLSVRFCGASHCCYCVVLLLLSLGGTAAARLGSLAPPSTQPTNTPSARLLYVSTCPLLSAHP